jgi:hypothetical protein
MREYPHPTIVQLAHPKGVPVLQQTNHRSLETWLGTNRMSRPGAVLTALVLIQGRVEKSPPFERRDEACPRPVAILQHYLRHDAPLLRQEYTNLVITLRWAGSHSVPMNMGFWYHRVHLPWTGRPSPAVERPLLQRGRYRDLLWLRLGFTHLSVALPRASSHYVAMNMISRHQRVHLPRTGGERGGGLWRLRGLHRRGRWFKW